MAGTLPLNGAPPTAELCTQVRLHYARQMHMMDGDDFAGFAGTFTEDGEFILAGGRGVLNGREAIRKGSEAAAARYNGGQPRHWFDMLEIETGDDGLINVSCYAMVSVTDREGGITWEPSCLVRDTLVWRGGRLFNASRAIERDDHIAQRRGA